MGLFLAAIAGCDGHIETLEQKKKRLARDAARKHLVAPAKKRVIRRIKQQPGSRVVPFPDDNPQANPNQYCPNGICPVPVQSTSLDRLPIPVVVGFAAIPDGMAIRNWEDRNGNGSCAWAALITALRWQNQDALANRVMQLYAGAASQFDVTNAAKRVRIKHAATVNAESELLEWASQTGRAGVIFYKRKHAVTFNGYKNHGGRDYAVITDPNFPNKYELVEKQKFLYRWRNEFGGFFLVPVYTPGTPAPGFRTSRSFVSKDISSCV